MKFEAHATGNKSTKDNHVIKQYHGKRHLLSSRLVVFLPENPKEEGDRLRWIIQGNEGRNDSDELDEDIVALVDELLEYKSIPQKKQN